MFSSIAEPFYVGIAINIHNLGFASKYHSIHFSFQVACAMKHLEKSEIVHRDLAARNIMINEWSQAKVGDFGLARLVTSTK